MAVTVPVLFLLLVPHTWRPWGEVGWGIAGEEGCLQALEDRAPETCSRQPGKAEHQEWPALPWFPESGLGHWGPVVGSDTLAHSPAQTSAMLTSYKFTYLTCCLGDGVVNIGWEQALGRPLQGAEQSPALLCSALHGVLQVRRHAERGCRAQEAHMGQCLGQHLAGVWSFPPSLARPSAKLEARSQPRDSGFLGKVTLLLGQVRRAVVTCAGRLELETQFLSSPH